VNNFETEQLVFAASMTGDFGDFALPAGTINFAAGAEWREEKSKSLFDPLVQGILPVTTAFGNQGERLADIAPGLATPGNPYDQRSLVFDSESLIQNVSGSYDVYDVFGEVSVPLLANAPMAQELTFDAAVRISNYSTIGTTTTWKTGGSWTPIADTLRLRGAYSVAVRAPNIDELFSPSQSAFFRPVDPCDVSEINALLSVGDPRGPIRQANCAAAGIPANFSDPLTARFVGATSGNPDLQEEEADTITFGFVVTPGFLEGLSFSLDYWDIQIDDAIDAPSGQSIVDSCYDSAQFPDNQFCELIRRNPNPNSPQFNGLEFIRQQQLNIGSLEASGVDFDVRYQTDVGRYEMLFAVSGTWMDKLDRFFDPTNPEAVDPELGELQRPEWAANFLATLSAGALGLNYKLQYLDEQALRDVEIETIDALFGPAGMADETFVHDIAATWDISEQYRLYGGINNIGDERPFITEFAFPVNPIGRFFFVGLDVRIE
jgi:outer membrane receptor protein involved in Fe transport